MRFTQQNVSISLFVVLLGVIVDISSAVDFPGPPDYDPPAGSVPAIPPGVPVYDNDDGYDYDDDHEGIKPSMYIAARVIAVLIASLVAGGIASQCSKKDDQPSTGKEGDVEAPPPTGDNMPR